MRLLLISGETDSMRELAEEIRREHVLVETEWAGSMRGKWGERFLEQMKDCCPADALLLSVKESPELLDFLPDLRDGCKLPIVVMGSRNEQNYYEEILCFRQGADDYVRPATEVPVLLLRLQRLINLYQEVPGRSFYKGLEEGETDYYWQGSPLHLTAKEYGIFYDLMHSRKEMVSREELVRSVWHHPVKTELTQKQGAALNSMIQKLKKKLDQVPVKIDSCYGKGYRLIYSDME